MTQNKVVLITDASAGVPPVAPAVANAVFALTGKRVRKFGIQRSA